MVTQYDLNGTQVFALTPNCSADWEQNKRLLLFLSVPCLTIALIWSSFGMWMVLPFAGLEIGLLAFFMYHICCRNFRRLLIIIEPEHIKIQAGVFELQDIYVFSRSHSQLNVTKATRPYDCIGIYLADDVFSIDIGEFLNGRDREELRNQLKQVGLREVVDRWWED